MASHSSFRPSADESPPYYSGYVALAPDGKIVDALAEQGKRLVGEWRAAPESARGLRYADGKWTTEEVLAHIVDIERVLAYRAMCFLRGVKGEQPGVDQDLMVPRSLANERGLESLVTEFEHQRLANVELFRGLAESLLDQRGVASGGEMSVRALLYILFGHAEHHAKVLAERYFPVA
ncbi:MAG: hypothetical protein ACJA2W_000883 [Planctomycetota bacterium]|jgi:hypothetical protein